MPKISALPAAASVALTDILPEVSPAVGGVTYKATFTQVLTLFQANIVTPANGGILYTDATSVQLLAPTATANKVLMSGASSAPHWSTPTYPTASGTAGQILRSDGTNNVYTTATYPTTTTINQILYSSSASVVSGLATANSAALVTTSAGVPVMSGVMTNGQLIVGSTGATPTATTLTAGAGVSITNGAGAITISVTASGLSWSNIAGTTQAAAVDSGYVCTNAGATTITCPATAALGSSIQVEGLGAAGWILTANAGQTIKLGGATTSSAGTLTSVAATDNVLITCIVANTTWRVLTTNSAGLTVA